MSNYKYDHQAYMEKSGKVGDSYVDRHAQRRVEEAAIEASYQRDEIRGHDRSDSEVLGFNSTLSLDQIAAKIIFGHSPRKFKKSFRII